MADKDDWRLMGQESFLSDRDLVHVPEYKPRSKDWGHERCIFCMATISPYEGDLHEGYYTEADKQWICKGCFEDFRDMSDWTVIREE